MPGCLGFGTGNQETPAAPRPRRWRPGGPAAVAAAPTANAATWQAAALGYKNLFWHMPARSSST